MSTARLTREVKYLRARAQKHGGPRPRVPDDKVGFARAAGLEKPDPWQEKLLRSESRRIILNCGRQSGKTTTAAISGLYNALHRSGSLILVLSPSLRQSQEFHRKVLEAYNALGRPMRACSERRLGLELGNGSRIEALPGSEKTIRGFSEPTLIILDEASRVTDDLYYSVRPMLAVSGGSLYMLSTPYGKRGFFYREWAEGFGWERYEIPATTIPRISEDFLHEERAAMGERTFRQEYMCSFEDVEGQVFTSEIIEQAFSDEVEPLWLEEEWEGGDVT